MSVPFMIVMMVFVFVMFVVMFMMMFMAIIYHSANAAYAVSAVPGEFELPALKAELGQLIPQLIGIDSEIDKSPQGHVAGNTGKAVKMQNFHYIS
jgi:hypothetical protein